MKPGRRGAKALLGGTAIAQLCALLRYTLLARLLGPQQLGLAVTLILTSQFFESISDSGSDRFLIQDRDGDEPRVQRLVHLLAVVRGVSIALALIVFSRPIAHFYHQPVLASGLIGLALAPFIMGFMHYDLRRMQRHHDFTREGTVMMAAESVGLIATAIAAYITRDFTAALYGLIVRAFTMVIVSRLTAQRPYQLGYSREHAKRLATFAMPLVANGLLLFVAGQGDRLLIGNRLGVAQLGHYSAILLLIYYPSMMISRYVTAMHLPVIAAARHSNEGLHRATDALAGETLLLALAMAAGFAIIAPVAVPLLYGTAFRQPEIVVALIGILQAFRFVRLWPTTEALAIGRSGIVLTNNLFRMMAFPAAIVGLTTIGGLVGLTIGFMMSEVAALAVAVVLVNRALGRPLFADSDRFAILTAACGSIAAAAWGFGSGHLVLAVLAGAGSVALICALCWRERTTMARAMQITHQWRTGLARDAG